MQILKTIHRITKTNSLCSITSIARCTPSRFYAVQQPNAKEVIERYTEQDGEKILKIINNSNVNELLRYDITKGRANKLLTWRMRNGLLANLNDIFMVDGFGVKATEKFYQSLLQEPKSEDNNAGKPNRLRTAPFITPHIEPEQQMNIGSCVSLRIGVNSITWSRLELPAADYNGPCELTHWQHHELAEKKLHINELIHRCLYVNHQIPEADCYLFENPQMAQVSNNPGSVDQQNVNIQKAQVTAIMGYALASRQSRLEQMLEKKTPQNDDKLQPRSLIFYVRRFLTARLFNHLVGTERVSSEETILNMMRTYYNMDATEDYVAQKDDENTQKNGQQANDGNVALKVNVQFPVEQRDMFSKAPRYHREYLGQALLLNLTFIRLVLLQDAESIAKVSRGNKAKNEIEEL
ncbi:uncharacterized protein LOC106093409 [Stomoxys calcitrans]|uniref:uncharacterized protein LOC106093409 n=1 Tax=Stomoxys calcitrans TaxID=35570 RepID=UPI0027E240EE|nr:uncharacterized protein LOC106093409 [Stomoxys calcitrans]